MTEFHLSADMTLLADGDCFTLRWSCGSQFMFSGSWPAVLLMLRKHFVLEDDVWLKLDSH